MFKILYKINKNILYIHIKRQIKLFSMSTSTNNTNISKDVIYDKKRILEIFYQII